LIVHAAVISYGSLIKFVETNPETEVTQLAKWHVWVPAMLVFTTICSHSLCGHWVSLMTGLLITGLDLDWNP